MALDNTLEWSTGRKILLAVMGIGLTSFAKKFHPYIKPLLERKNLQPLEDLPDLTTWLGFYKDYKSVFRKPFNTLLTEDSNWPTFDEMIRLKQLMAYLGRMHEDDLRKIIESIPKKELDDSREKASPAIKEEVDAFFKEIEQGNQTTIDYKAVSRAKWHEMQFLMRVYIPCILLHQQSPFTLFYQARHGNIDAIINLAKLDQSILFEPMISRRLHLMGHSCERHGLSERIYRAMTKKHKCPNLKALKTTLAGLVKFAFSQTGDKLTSVEIRQLLDALVNDSSNGKQMIDTDLPQAPETFSKAIQRSLKQWRENFQPDK